VTLGNACVHEREANLNMSQIPPCRIITIGSFRILKGQGSVLDQHHHQMLLQMPLHSVAQLREGRPSRSSCTQYGRRTAIHFLSMLGTTERRAPLDGNAPDSLLSRLPGSHSTSCPLRPRRTRPRRVIRLQALVRSCVHRTGLLSQYTARRYSQMLSLHPHQAGSCAVVNTGRCKITLRENGLTL